MNGMSDADTELIKRTVAATCRQLSEWFDEREATALLDMAREVEAFNDARDACCPCCQEVTCDDGCPLAPVRNHTEN